MATNYSPKIVTSGLVMYLDAANQKSYPGAGTAWTDMSHSEQVATLNGSPTFESGTSASINTTSSQWANTGSTPTSLQGNPELTVVSIMRRTADTVGVGTWGIGGSTTNQGINSYNSPSYTNEIGIDLWGQETFTTPGVITPLDEWVFLAWQKTTGVFSRANCTIWKNTDSYTGDALRLARGIETRTPSVNDHGITVGGIQNSSTYAGPVDIGMFMIYDRVLTEDELMVIYNTMKARYGL